MYYLIYFFLILTSFPIYAKDEPIGIAISQEISDQIKDEKKGNKDSILFLGMNVCDNSPNHFFGEEYLNCKACYDKIVAINPNLDQIKTISDSLKPNGKLILFYFPLESKHWRFLETIFGPETTLDITKQKQYRNSLKMMNFSILKCVSIPNVAIYQNKEQIINEFLSFPSIWKVPATKENLQSFADHFPNDEMILVRYRYLLVILQSGS